MFYGGEGGKSGKGRKSPSRHQRGSYALSPALTDLLSCQSLALLVVCESEASTLPPQLSNTVTRIVILIFAIFVSISHSALHVGVVPERAARQVTVLSCDKLPRLITHFAYLNRSDYAHSVSLSCRSLLLAVSSALKFLSPTPPSVYLLCDGIALKLSNLFYCSPCSQDRNVSCRAKRTRPESWCLEFLPPCWVSQSTAQEHERTPDS